MSTQLAFRSRAIRYKRPRIASAMGWLAAACQLTACVACVVGMMGVRTSSVVVWSALAAPCFGILWALVRGFVLPWKGDVRIDGETLVVRRRRIPRERVAGGMTIDRGDGTDVDLTLTNGDRCVVRAPTPETAEALLEALHVDPRRRRYTLRWGRAVSRVLISLSFTMVVPTAMVFVMSKLRIETGYLFALCYLVAPLVGVWAARTFGWHEVTIGTDGVEFRSGLRRRFAAFVDVARVDSDAEGVWLVFHDGKAVLVRANADDFAQRSALLRRIAQARAHVAEPAAAAPAARAGRGIAEWRQALVDQLRGAGGYREAPLPPEAAVAIVENPSASVEHRIAAALALSAEPDAAARVRVAAEACANPRVRVALEGAVDGTLDDETVEAALAR